MPYIDKEVREKLASGDFQPRTPGELNFAFTTLATNYLALKGLNYTHLNDVLGALEGAKQEFYRRVAVPYENNKLSVNGDVY